MQHDIQNKNKNETTWNQCFGTRITFWARLTKLPCPRWHWLLLHQCGHSLSRTLSGNKEHFEDLKLYKGKEVTGISGGLEIAGEGTFVFNIQSDDGVIDTIKIPRSLYVHGIKLPLLSPQHWAETARDHSPIKFGTKIEVDEEGSILLWKQQTRRKRILHDPLTKTPILGQLQGPGKIKHFKPHSWPVMPHISGTTSPWTWTAYEITLN